MATAHVGLPERRKRTNAARRAAVLAALRHATPVGISDSREQFDDYDDSELWDLADEAADDELYRAAHREIARRRMQDAKRKPFQGPVRMVLAFLLIMLLIVGPILALWIMG